MRVDTVAGDVKPFQHCDPDPDESPLGADPAAQPSIPTPHGLPEPIEIGSLLMKPACTLDQAPLPSGERGWGEGRRIDHRDPTDMHKIPPLQQERARALRHGGTDAEHWLWQHLRSRQLLGQKFRRQVPIGQYIVDFLCCECKLIVEVDGSQHRQQEGYDRTRTQCLESQGYRVIRYWNNEVLQQGDAVLESILQALAAGRQTP